MPELGIAFDEALLLASSVHRQQRRKGSDVPYLAHLLAVASLVLEAGGDEEQAVAALLHDALEDHPEQAPYELLARKFGSRVADIVRDCSDSESHPKPPWHVRKTSYLVQLERQHPDALLVSLADKLHNARSTLRDVRAIGPGAWSRFNVRREDHLWYYASLLAVFEARLPHEPMTADLRHVVAELETA